LIFDDVIDSKKAILQRIHLNVKNDVEIYIKREDAVHPALSGNKWRKLKYNLIDAKDRGYNKLLTFGGAYSNHIYATASAGKLFGFETIGIIRGEEHLPLNPTLQFASDQGMVLNYLPRNIYRRRNEQEFQRQLAEQLGDVYIVPEGGSNLLALKGVAEMINEIDVDFDYVISAVGSGGTAAGIITALKGNQKYIGVPALKGGEYLNDIIAKFLYEYSERVYNNWELITDFHFGGFAKITHELIDFKMRFEDENDIELDNIYTSKMLFALERLINTGYIPNGSKIIAIHTGGLQGNKGMMKKVERLREKISV